MKEEDNENIKIEILTDNESEDSSSMYNKTENKNMKIINEKIDNYLNELKPSSDEEDEDSSISKKDEIYEENLDSKNFDENSNSSLSDDNLSNYSSNYSNTNEEINNVTFSNNNIISNKKSENTFNNFNTNKEDLEKKLIEKNNLIDEIQILDSKILNATNQKEKYLSVPILKSRFESEIKQLEEEKKNKLVLLNQYQK
jgi:hypothetical protein